MTTARQKNSPARLFLRRLGTLVLFVIVVTAIIGVWNIYQKERESRALRDQAERQLQDMQTQQQKLQADIATLQTERGKEAALREQYAVGRSGEQMVVIVDPDAPKPAATSTSRFSAFMHSIFPWW